VDSASVCGVDSVQSGALARACRQIDLERYLEERRLLGGYLDRC
jgi:hypothetical protein